jgi:hypothetical protein
MDNDSRQEIRDRFEGEGIRERVKGRRDGGKGREGGGKAEGRKGRVSTKVRI